MTTQEMISKYNITLHNDTQIAVGRNPKSLKPAEKQALVDAKPEILAYLKAEKQAKEYAAKARTAAINAIEGLDAIRKAMHQEYLYDKAFNRMMESEDGCINPPAPPKVSSDELKQEYPRAAAYIKADDWATSSNMERRIPGKKALERIINGEDYNIAIADMDAEHAQAVRELAMRD